MSAASDMSRARPLAANDNIASGSWGSGSFTYDPLGNLRSKTLGARTVSLSYDNTKNRVSQSSDTGGSGMASTGTRTVDYDLRGNVTTLGDLTFYYDMSNQPTSVTGGVNANYRYDGHMRRARSVVNGKLIYNVYDLSGSLVHVHRDTDNEQIDYIPGPTGTLARIKRDDGLPSTDEVTYLHSDHLGSASSGTNGSGAVQWTERYTPYGEALLSPSANDDLAGYTGHIHDKALGLTYMQARYQDPVMGRFLSIDPVTFMADGRPGMFNRYSYTLNDPVNMWDPDGLATICAEGSGSKLRRCVDVDGDGDGETDDDDLTSKEKRKLSSAFGTFISKNSGADISGEGAITLGEGKNTNFVRATSQFVGAATDLDFENTIINVVSSFEMSRVTGEWPFPPAGYLVSTGSPRSSSNMILIKRNSRYAFKHGGNMARLIIHELGHRPVASSTDTFFGPSSTEARHRQLDAWARQTLINSGLGDRRCDRVGGFSRC